MKILIIGGGGREHALAWKISKSPRVKKIFCAPGNGGTSEISHNIQISVSNSRELLEFALAEKIDLTVVGPDDVLAAGLVDLFQENGLRIFGPTQAAARLESSKVFAKDFMERHGIPTARSGRFTKSAEAHAYCQKMECPVVIKADGLAFGKGVIIAQSPREAAMAIYRIMDQREFGEAGAAVVIEEFLTGEECSIHALVDGRNYLLFPAAQDHKRAFDGDAGPNTGGMGTCSPVPLVNEELAQKIRVEVLDRFVAGLARDGLDFSGMLFPGLMITPQGLKVLEFNCRFGDPETQVLLPRLKTDLVDLLEATIDRRLDQASASWVEQAAVCVVLASGGYPGKYQTGLEIHGLEAAEQLGTEIFHAGTRRTGTQLLTSGGRVLGVTALGEDLHAARELAYKAVEAINFPGKHSRTDIGLRSIQERSSKT